jgi:rod shape-determining protein MreC
MRPAGLSRRSSPRWIALGLLLAAVILMVLQAPGRHVEAPGSQLVVPVQQAVVSVGNRVRAVVDTVRHAQELQEQNVLYRQEIERLQAEMVRLRELELENDDLRRLLGLRQQFGQGELVPVRVIGRDPLPFAQVLIIDGGSEQGLREDLPVLTWRGLVGRVIAVESRTAKVLLVTDASSSISGRVQNPASRATGVVRGRNDEWLVMQYLPQGEPVRTGDLVITSGLGGVFPPGMPIGKVVQVRRRDQDLFQEALIEPASPLNHLERLYVLKPEAPAGE